MTSSVNWIYIVNTVEVSVYRFFIEVLYLQWGVTDTYYWLTITSGAYIYKLGLILSWVINDMPTVKN